MNEHSNFYVQKLYGLRYSGTDASVSARATVHLALNLLAKIAIFCAAIGMLRSYDELMVATKSLRLVRSWNRLILSILPRTTLVAAI